MPTKRGRRQDGATSSVDTDAPQPKRPRGRPPKSASTSGGATVSGGAASSKSAKASTPGGAPT